MGATIFVRDCETRLGVSEIGCWELRLLQGYVDADYAGDLDQRKSTMAHSMSVSLVGRQSCKIQLFFQ